MALRSRSICIFSFQFARGRELGDLAYHPKPEVLFFQFARGRELGGFSQCHIPFRRYFQFARGRELGVEQGGLDD